MLKFFQHPTGESYSTTPYFEDWQLKETELQGNLTVPLYDGNLNVTENAS